MDLRWPLTKVTEGNYLKPNPSGNTGANRRS